MFTGIVETLGRIKALEKKGGNLNITIETPLAEELKTDQSIAHNGACLTVVEEGKNAYTVTAVAETLSKTNLGLLREGDLVNLERAMVLGTRIDGHLVQGHVDQTAICKEITEEDGSWRFSFQYDPTAGNLTIEKGSITVDGTSLTVVDSGADTFSVAIIPYTYEHTLFQTYQPGSVVNLEFDMIGKYVARMMQTRQ